MNDDEFRTRPTLEPPKRTDTMPAPEDELSNETQIFSKIVRDVVMDLLAQIDDANAKLVQGELQEINKHLVRIDKRLEEGNGEFAALHRQNIELMTAYGALAGSLRPAATAVSGSQIKVLIVDDEPFVRNALARLLESRGLHVIEAGSFRAALDALVSDPSVAMVDIRLGSDDGLELIAEMRRLRPQLKFVIYSALVTPIQRERARLFDATVIEKPALDNDALVSEIIRAHGAELAS